MCRVEDGSMNANSDKDYIDARTDAIRASLEGRFDGVNARIDGLNARLDAVDAHFDQLRAEINSAVDRAMTQMLKWTVGLFFAMATIFLSSMAFFMNTVVANIPAQLVLATSPAVMYVPTPATAPGSLTSLRSPSDERQF